MRRVLLGLSLVTACGSAPEPRPAPVPASVPATETWLKGQLHAHTSNSSDSQTPPGAALQWFARHGFDFVVVTDHNFVTVAVGGPVPAIPGIELTQNLDRCHPAPEAGPAASRCGAWRPTMPITMTTPPAWSSAASRRTSATAAS